MPCTGEGCEECANLQFKAQHNRWWSLVFGLAHRATLLFVANIPRFYWNAIRNQLWLASIQSRRANVTDVATRRALEALAFHRSRGIIAGPGASSTGGTSSC